MQVGQQQSDSLGRGSLDITGRIQPRKGVGASDQRVVLHMPAILDTNLVAVGNPVLRGVLHKGINHCHLLLSIHVKALGECRRDCRAGSTLRLPLLCLPHLKYLSVHHISSQRRSSSSCQRSAWDLICAHSTCMELPYLTSQLLEYPRGRRVVGSVDNTGSPKSVGSVGSGGDPESVRSVGGGSNPKSVGGVDGGSDIKSIVNNGGRGRGYPYPQQLKVSFTTIVIILAQFTVILWVQCPETMLSCAVEIELLQSDKNNIVMLDHLCAFCLEPLIQHIETLELRNTGEDAMDVMNILKAVVGLHKSETTLYGFQRQDAVQVMETVALKINACPLSYI
ncbi:hypothetical protein C8Q80DRAFT_1122959 [Daedaleopsis nitida]|nr:hypothetical protein C8Q80DRAFT_1122959 [Daedaleopsis nitida]